MNTRSGEEYFSRDQFRTSPEPFGACWQHDGISETYPLVLGNVAGKSAVTHQHMLAAVAYYDVRDFMIPLPSKPKDRIGVALKTILGEISRRWTMSSSGWQTGGGSTLSSREVFDHEETANTFRLASEGLRASRKLRSSFAFAHLCAAGGIK